MTYDEREARLRRFYAAVHTDRLLSSAHAAMKVADDEQTELRARLATAEAGIEALPDEAIIREFRRRAAIESQGTPIRVAMGLDFGAAS